MAVLDLCLRLGLAGVFAVGSATKIVDMRAFAEAIADYQLLPKSLVGLSARIIPPLELAVAAGLLVPALVWPAAIGGSVLLAAFAGAMVINLRRGRRIKCGCAGASSASRISWALVARNGVLIGGVLVAASAGRAGVLAAGDILPALVIVSVGVLTVASGGIALKVAQRMRLLSAGPVR